MFFYRLVIPWVVSTSYWRVLQCDEVDSWEFLLIVIPEPPIVLGTIAANRPQAEITDWLKDMEREAFQICTARGLIFYREKDLVPHP